MGFCRISEAVVSVSLLALAASAEFLVHLLASPVKTFISDDRRRQSTWMLWCVLALEVKNQFKICLRPVTEEVIVVADGRIASWGDDLERAHFTE